MKKGIKVIFILCALLAVAAGVLVMISSRDELPNPTEPEPTEFHIADVAFTKTQVELSEAENSIGAGFGLSKELETVELGGVTYGFEPAVSMADRESCIRATEAVLARIGADRKLQVNIYTETTYDAVFVKDGAVFTHVQDWRAAEYIAVLVQGLFGEYCNYGAVYGYAGYLGRLVFDLPLTLWDADWEFTDDKDKNVLDLNLLCFSSQFFAGKDVKAAKRIANTFVADYIIDHGEAAFQTLLSQSGTVAGADAFSGALTDFYTARQLSYTPSTLLLCPGGRSYDYIVKSEYAVMHVEKDWLDANRDLCPLTYDGFLHQNYADVRSYFTTIIEEMGAFQTLFSLESYDNDLDVYFTNHYNKKASYYIAASHSMSIVNTASFATCYIRSLLGQSDLLQEDWVVGFATLFSYRHNHYGNAMNNNECNMDSDSKALQYIREFRANVGRDVDMAVDHVEILHIAVYTRDLFDPNRNATAAASFAAYLISRLGEAQVLDLALRTHDYGEHTYEALASDWKAFIVETYSGYTKYR